MTVENPVNPKHSITHGEVIGHIWESYSVLRIDLLTGRTHQIRVHLSSIWFPIIGDSVYGNKDINNKAKQEFWLSRQALHAIQIELILYEKDIIFFASLKPDMQKIIDSHNIKI
jgi:23S rRNA pseudouridine955/2504/2580 synthase